MAISPGIAIATGLFHRALQLLLDYFTGPCNCCGSISPGIAIATGLFHWALQLLWVYFTGDCNCYWIISQGLAIAVGLFHWTLQLLLDVRIKTSIKILTAYICLCTLFSYFHMSKTFKCFVP
jgi:hypothetical protein